MKIAYDSRDFTNSALSLATGMLVVAGLAAWRSGGNISILSLTLGLPVGVLSFWAMYAMKMRALEKEPLSYQNAPQDIMEDAEIDAHQSIPILERPTYAGLTLEALRENQRLRSLKGRTVSIQADDQDRPTLDQWHQ
jgi:hypothetical protein